MVSKRRMDFNETSIRRHFDILCPLGSFILREGSPCSHHQSMNPGILNAMSMP